MDKLKYFFKKYLPDIIILLGLFWYLTQEYRFPISNWQIIEGKVNGDFVGFQYEWSRIISIMIMVFGLDVAVRRWVSIRKRREII